MNDRSGWYSVRCIFRADVNRRWGVHDLAEGEHVFEERITLFRASSASDAISRAEVAANQYASELGFEYLGLAQSCYLYDEPSDGAEVFSLFRRSRLLPQLYVDAFFSTGTEYELDLQ